ncbi:MAG: MMPL family transporter, partial [Gammaproteobacteria bacterium]|nr:MMPL family transporter [Gammaproteobacteria bacterium]
KVEQIANSHNSEDFQIYVAGTSVITQTLKKFMMTDMKRFLRLAVVTIAVCLFIMFRRASGVFLPLLVVALTLITTLGVMAAAGFQFKTPTTILPSFLLAVGVGDSVHILALTYLNLRRGMVRNEAIINAFSHAGLALVMTTLTTAAGLASFAAAKVAPIADLGLFSAVGVLIALFYTFTFLPAALSIIPLKIRKESAEGPVRISVMDRLLDSIGAFSIQHHRGVLIASFLVIGCGIAGLFRVSFSHDVLTWLPENLPVRQATEVINKDLRGSVVLEMILDTGVENGLYDRKTLASIDKLATELEQDYKENQLFVGKVTSLTTILKEINQALHENNQEYYRVPENARLIPQELLLFENSGSDDLEDVIDSQFRIARISLKVPWLDALQYLPFINDVEARFHKEF